MPLIASSNCWLDLRPKIKPATLNHNQSRSCPWVKKVSITSVLFRHFPGLDMIDILCDIALSDTPTQMPREIQNLWSSGISFLHFFFFVRAPTGAAVAFIPVYCMGYYDAAAALKICHFFRFGAILPLSIYIHPSAWKTSWLPNSTYLHLDFYLLSWQWQPLWSGGLLFLCPVLPEKAS